MKISLDSKLLAELSIFAKELFSVGRCTPACVTSEAGRKAHLCNLNEE